MKRNLLIFATLFTILFLVYKFAFNNPAKVTPTPKKQLQKQTETVKKEASNATIQEFKPNQELSSILTNFKSWKKYDNENIDFSLDFIPFNEKQEEIEKTLFFEKLVTGNYVAVKLDTEDISYQLFELKKDLYPKIKKGIATEASVGKHYFEREGVKFENLSFTDMKGKTYTSKNLKGKFLVLKCWFINCRVCVEEFPELNDLHERYKQRKDVVFLSLAFDRKNKLEDFLSKRKFAYPTIPRQKQFMMKTLVVKRYPTHLILKDGVVLKMVDNVKSLVTALDKITGMENK